VKDNNLIKTIIWDFNGTLLDDMQVCVGCMNILLKERDLPALDLQHYREIFTFPVRDYYVSLGFDFRKEPFDIPAHQFIDLYRKNLHLAPLHDDAGDTLGFFHRNHFHQLILSAMEQEFLEDTLNSKGILHFFDKVAGITNHLGEGKLEMARELVASLGRKPEEICLVGDTIHDFEVAQGSGISCILIANGHQSYERLKTLNCLVLKEIKDLTENFPIIINS
jgi:phosphoglycolate phosphatase